MYHIIGINFLTCPKASGIQNAYQTDYYKDLDVFSQEPIQSQTSLRDLQISAPRPAELTHPAHILRVNIQEREAREHRSQISAVAFCVAQLPIPTRRYLNS